jgi:hypothetical protein
MFSQPTPASLCLPALPACLPACPARLPHPPTLGDEGQLWSKALHVVCLLLQEAEGDELGEVGVLVPSLLERLVQVALQGCRVGQGRAGVVQGIEWGPGQGRAGLSKKRGARSRGLVLGEAGEYRD